MNKNGQKIAFYLAAREIMIKKRKYFRFILASDKSILKKKSTSLTNFTGQPYPPPPSGKIPE